MGGFGVHGGSLAAQGAARGPQGGFRRSFEPVPHRRHDGGVNGGGVTRGSYRVQPGPDGRNHCDKGGGCVRGRAHVWAMGGAGGRSWGGFAQASDVLRGGRRL